MRSMRSVVKDLSKYKSTKEVNTKSDFNRRKERLALRLLRSIESSQSEGRILKGTMIRGELVLWF